MTILSKKRVLAFSGLSLPLAALGLPITVYLPPFYAEEMGLGLATVGLVFTLARIWDVITDPIMGIIIDRFPSRWGRRRHLIVLGNPLILLAACFIYLPSHNDHSGAYLLGWLIVLYVGYTFIMIAHQSWGAELTADYNERSRLYGWREILSFVGMLAVLTLPTIIEQSGGDDYDKIASMGWYLLLLLPLATLVCVIVVPERPHLAADRTKLPTKIAIKSILQNSPLRRLLLADLSIAFATGATGSTYIFVVTWVFDNAENASLILLAYFASGLVAMPLWMRLSYKLGKHNMIVIAMSYAVLTLIGFPIAAYLESTLALVIATILFGFAFGAGQMILRAMMADVADWDELETGAKRGGLFFALLTTTNKVGGALSVSVTYAALAFVGFDPAATTISAEAKDGLLWTFVLLPTVFFVVAAIALRHYPLDRSKQEEIRAALDQHQQ